MSPMTKRIAAAVLWFLAGWYLGSFIAVMTGLSDLLGPLVGMIGAALFAGDPFGRIWKPSTEASASTSPAVGAPSAVLDR